MPRILLVRSTAAPSQQIDMQIRTFQCGGSDPGEQNPRDAVAGPSALAKQAVLRRRQHFATGLTVPNQSSVKSLWRNRAKTSGRYEYRLQIARTAGISRQAPSPHRLKVIRRPEGQTTPAIAVSPYAPHEKRMDIAACPRWSVSPLTSSEYLHPNRAR